MTRRGPWLPQLHRAALPMSTPDTCPNCGADVPPKAKACPECGSCEETGWSDEASVSGLGLPNEEFDHADFVNREFGGNQPVPRGISPLWWLIAFALAILLLVLTLR